MNMDEFDLQVINAHLQVEVIATNKLKLPYAVEIILYFIREQVTCL